MFQTMIQVNLHKLALRLVFSNPRYIALSGIIFTAMFIPLSYIAEYLFFQPILVLFVPDYSAFGFSLVVIVSDLTGLVLSMGIYRIKILKSSKKKMSSGFTGKQQELFKEHNTGWGYFTKRLVIHCKK